MKDTRLSRALILFEQSRYKEAEKILKNMLSEDADNIELLSIFAEVNLQQNKIDIAQEVIENAIGLAPDVPNLFYTKSRIEIQKGKFKEAEKSIEQSISMNPYNADYFAVLANIKLTRKKFEEALEIANRSLEIDAENLIALNARSSALLKLNRSEESFETIENALKEDPNNAFTHANYGWGLLEKGDHKKALEHFKESLQNDPNFGYAQSGMLEAIKASNPIYNLFLKYSFWMSNLTSKYQWGVIFGFYFVFKVLRTIAKRSDTLQPYLIPLLIVLGLIAFSTWVITPISNLFLRFNPYGQLLLDEKEKMSSNFVAGSLILFLVGIILYFLADDVNLLVLSVFGFTMMIPFSVMFSETKTKNALLIYTVILAVVGIAAIGFTFLSGEIFNQLSILYLLGFVVFQWFSNYMLIKESNV